METVQGFSVKLVNQKRRGYPSIFPRNERYRTNANVISDYFAIYPTSFSRMETGLREPPRTTVLTGFPGI